MPYLRVLKILYTGKQNFQSVKVAILSVFALLRRCFYLLLLFLASLQKESYVMISPYLCFHTNLYIGKHKNDKNPAIHHKNAKHIIITKAKNADG